MLKEEKPQNLLEGMEYGPGPDKTSMHLGRDQARRLLAHALEPWLTDPNLPTRSHKTIAEIMDEPSLPIESRNTILKIMSDPKLLPPRSNKRVLEIVSDPTVPLIRSYEMILEIIMSDPILDPRSYDTIREIILGIMKYKLQEYYDESSLSDKINVVKRSLNRTGISVSEREIERALNEDADERASRQAVLGIFLALSIHHFGYDPEKRYQSATTDIENAISGVRKEDTIRKWLKIAAAEVVRH